MPRVADAAERRREIVAATVELVAEGGPEALTMRRVAERAGCTIGLINHWFDSRDDLIEAVLDAAATAAIERSRALARDPQVTLAELASEFLPLDRRRTTELRVWLVFWGLSIARPGLRAGYVRRTAAIRAEVVEELDRRARRDPAAAADLLMAALDGIAVNALADPDYWSPSRQRRVLEQLLVELR